MTSLSVVLFCIVVFCAGLVHTMCGFGFGVFVQVFFPYFMPSVVSGVSASVTMSTVTSSYTAVKAFRKAQYKKLLWPWAAFFVSNTFVVYYVTTQPDDFIGKLLAVALILLSLYFVFFSNRLKIRATPVTGIIVGLLSGILSGFFGMGGPPVALYLLACCDTNDEYLANSLTFMTVTGLYGIVVRALNGLFTWEIVLYCLIGIVFVLAGSAAGHKLVSKIPAKHVKRLIYAVMALSGVLMLVS